MVVIIKLQELYLRFEVDKIYWWNTKFKKLSHYAVQGGPKKADTRETVWVSAFLTTMYVSNATTLHNVCTCMLLAFKTYSVSQKSSATKTFCNIFHSG